MSTPVKVVNPAGRVDLLAQRLLAQGIQAHGGTALKVCHKVLENEIADAFTAICGPGTKADDWGKVIREWDERISKALQQVQAEERG